MPGKRATGQPTIFVNVGPAEFDNAAAEAKIEATIAKGMKQFRDEIERVWNEKAAAQFNTTTTEYMAGVNIVTTKDGVEAQINGFLPVALEQGMPRFDMKPGLLKRGGGRTVVPMRDGGFRSVSANSPAESWWHPGIQAADIGEQVKEEAPKIADRIFSRLLDRVEV